MHQCELPSCWVLVRWLCRVGSSTSPNATGTAGWVRWAHRHAATTAVAKGSISHRLAATENARPLPRAAEHIRSRQVASDIPIGYANLPGAAVTQNRRIGHASADYLRVRLATDDTI